MLKEAEAHAAGGGASGGRGGTRGELLAMGFVGVKKLGGTSQMDFGVGSFAPFKPHKAYSQNRKWNELIRMLWVDGKPHTPPNHPNSEVWRLSGFTHKNQHVKTQTNPSHQLGI